MSKYKNIKTLLKHLIGNENTISNNILFIDFTGSIEKGQYLSQLYYWSNRTKIPGGWIAKRHEDWYQEIRVKAHSIRRFSKEFSRRGFLEMKLKKFDGVTMPHYKVDQDVLIDQLLTFCKGNKLSTLQIVNLGVTNCQPSQGNKLSTSINRDYTDTTTEIYSARTKKENKEEEKPLPTKQVVNVSPQVAAHPPQPIQAELSWMQVSRDMSEWLKGEGADQWKFMCDNAGGYVEPSIITSAWAGKYSDSQYMLRKWRTEACKLQGWIRNELKSQRTQLKKNKGSGIDRLSVSTYGRKGRDIQVSKVPS